MCDHNDRLRYDIGFHCYDCNEFFHKDSPTYRSGELLSSLWMAVHNQCVYLSRDDKKDTDEYRELDAMRDKIGIGKKHDNYEEIITEAESVLSKRNSSAESVNIYLK